MPFLRYVHRFTAENCHLNKTFSYAFFLDDTVKFRLKKYIRVLINIHSVASNSELLF